MIQTILTTALSTVLLVNSTATPTPPATHDFTRVLTDQNYVTYSVEQDNNTYTVKLKKLGNTIQLPELQKDIVKNDKLVQPDTNIASTEVTLTVIPTVTPTVTPTDEPTVVEQSITQAPTLTASTSTGGISDTALDALGSCEAGNNPARNSGNGYYGAFQFSYGTWKSMNTGYDRADLAPIEVQKAAVKQLLNRSSIYNQFPGCARKMHGEGII